VGEVEAAIARLPEPPNGNPNMPVLSGESPLVGPDRSSAHSQFEIGPWIDDVDNHFRPSAASPGRGPKARVIAKTYNTVWRVTLHHYAARVAAA
jgi:hypothetical protein